MGPLVVNILTFLGVFFAICAGNAVLVDLYSTERKRLKKRLEEQFRTQQRERAKASPLLKEFSQIAAEAMAEGREGRSLRRSLAVLIEQSGLELSVGRFVAMVAGCGVLLGAVGGLALVNVPFGITCGIFGASLPYLYVCIKRRQRLEKLREQLPDAFDLMSRVLRAGQTVSQAMHCVSEEFSRPISLEFLYCYEQMNLGMSSEMALRELGRRTGLLEVKIFVLAVVVHRQTGGNLAELLDKLSYVVRERFRIQGMIKSLTAQGRFQAGILLSLPPFMFFLLMILHREYEMMLLQHPGLLVLAAALMGTGALWIRRVVNFDY